MNSPKIIDFFTRLKRSINYAPALYQVSGSPNRFLLFLIDMIKTAIQERNFYSARLLHDLPLYAMGASVFLDNGEGILCALELYGQKVYFPSSKFIIKSGDIVIDLGANIGVFSILAAKLGGQVVSVEAQEQMLPKIKKNLERNHLTAKVIHGMIGSGTGFFSATNQTIAPPITLDEIMTKVGLDHIDFLKIDIEGSEFGLFSKPGEWISKTEKIAMEIHPQFGNPVIITNTLKKAGFQVSTKQRNNQGFIYGWK